MLSKTPLGAAKNVVESRVSPFVLNHNIALRNVDTASHSIDAALDCINGNSGNSYITYSVARHTSLTDLYGVSNLFSPSSDSKKKVEEMSEQTTHVFLMLQDHLRIDNASLDWEFAIEIITKIKKPIIVFSLGANAVGTSALELAAAIPNPMRRFFSALSHGSESIGIRGDYTAEVLDRLNINNYSIVGCPTLFESGPDRRVQPAKYDPLAAIAATGLFSNVHENIQFFLQDESAFIRTLFKGRNPSSDEICSINDSYPLYRACALASRFSGRMHFFLEMKKWKEELSKNFMLAAGTRVHGAIIALNAGLPAICTNVDQRATEMCRMAGIPHLPGHCGLYYTADQLCELSDPAQLNEKYVHLYRNFRSWLHSLGIARDYFDGEISWPMMQLEHRERLNGLDAFTGPLFDRN